MVVCTFDKEINIHRANREVFDIFNTDWCIAWIWFMLDLSSYYQYNLLIDLITPNQGDVRLPRVQVISQEMQILSERFIIRLRCSNISMSEVHIDMIVSGPQVKNFFALLVELPWNSSPSFRSGALLLLYFAVVSKPVEC